MSIISRPRLIRIDLDPDQGFPVSVFIESVRFVEENGEKIADLPAHIESIAADSDQALAVLGELASTATAALLPYQSEVQRLAGELAVAKDTIARLEAKTVASNAEPLG